MKKQLENRIAELNQEINTFRNNPVENFDAIKALEIRLDELNKLDTAKRVRLTGDALRIRDERVIRDYKRGLKWKEIAKQHDLSHKNQIHYIFKRNGFKVYRNDIG